jgi:hypothetical protein
VTVRLYTFLGLLDVDIEDLKLTEDLGFDWHFVVSDDETFGVVVVGVFFPPFVLFHGIDSDAFEWLDCEDFLDEVLEIGGEGLGEGVLAAEDFLVELRSVLVVKGQAAADHCVEDDPRAPDVNHDGLVGVFGLDHLWCRVAGGPAGSFKSFLWLVGVGEAEVDDADGLVVVH